MDSAAFAVGILVGLVGAPIALWLVLASLRLVGFYAIVRERTCRVYVLFGNVVATLSEPGVHFLWFEIGAKGLILPLLGKCHVLDLRLDQQYLRSLAVNSEEGAPIGIGVWYEMYVSDPLAYLFRNADPRGSLAANVKNSSIRCLSNMKLGDMLETRHTMSRAVRAEVSPNSHEWGYKLGSVYIRKVHFRDEGMIRQIEEKVVNRLRQVTSAIRQDGANQVNVITGTADRQAAAEFARAAAIRPAIVGDALRRIGEDPEVATALFDVLEVQRLLESPAELTLLPAGMSPEALSPLVAARTRAAAGTPRPA